MKSEKGSSFSDRCLLSLAIVTLLVTSAGVTFVRAAPETAAQTLPSYCGVVGASGYGPLPSYPVPSVVPHGTVITVVTTSDVVNGNVSSVSALERDPGPDGISLREAITATNNDPGLYTIDFAPSLKGATILIGDWLQLQGGNVFINGDVNGNGKPDVTVEGTVAMADATKPGMLISSSGNTISGLELQNFWFGIALRPSSANGIYRDNTFSHLVISSNVTGSAGIGNFQLQTNDTFINTVISNNIINASNGIALVMPGSSYDKMIRDVIINNTIYAGEVNSGDAIDYMAGIGYGTHDSALNSVIAYNTVYVGESETGSFGMQASAGGLFNNDSQLNGLQIVGNSIHMSNVSGVQEGINVQASGESTSYAQGNLLENVTILGNFVNGFAGAGIDLGKLTGKNNTMKDITVMGNQIAIGPGKGPQGIKVDSGTLSEQSAISNENVITSVTIQWNTIQLIGAVSGSYNAGIFMVGGWFRAENNSIDGVRIVQNSINSGEGSAIFIDGGTSPAIQNHVSDVRISCNSIVSNETISNPPEAPLYLVGANCNPGPTCTGNSVRNVQIEDNLVSGVLDNVTLLGSALPGPGNTISNVTVISHYTLQSGGSQYPVAAESNSSTLGVDITQTRSLVFMFGSSGGTGSFANMTLPIELLKGPFTVSANGNPIAFVLARNSTDYSLYATFPVAPSHSVPGGFQVPGPTAIEISTATTNSTTTSTATTTSTSSTSSTTATTSSTSTTTSPSASTTTATTSTSSSTLASSSSTLSTRSSSYTTTTSSTITSSQTATTLELALVGVAAVVLVVLGAIFFRRRHS